MYDFSILVSKAHEDTQEMRVAYILRKFVAGNKTAEFDIYELQRELGHEKSPHGIALRQLITPVDELRGPGGRRLSSKANYTLVPAALAAYKEQTVAKEVPGLREHIAQQKIESIMLLSAADATLDETREFDDERAVVKAAIDRAAAFEAWSTVIEAEKLNNAGKGTQALKRLSKYGIGMLGQSSEQGQLSLD